MEQHIFICINNFRQYIGVVKKYGVIEIKGNKLI